MQKTEEPILRANSFYPFRDMPGVGKQKSLSWIPIHLPQNPRRGTTPNEYSPSFHFFSLYGFLTRTKKLPLSMFYSRINSG